MMWEFRSKIEDLVETEELKIRQEIAFGKYSSLIPEASKGHPAKYNPELVEFLIEKYTQPGDTVADIMAGTGLLGIIAALHGRNAIQVELEPRYFEWMEKARENVERLNTLTPKGRIVNILGDSRRLTELLAERVGAVITSPPYTNTACEDVKNTYKYRKGGLFAEEKLAIATRGDNIGNLPLGPVDAVITSPPYGDAVSDDKEGPLAGADVKRYGRWREGTARKHSYTQHLVSVKPGANVDAVITSPPYERILSHERHHTPNTGSAEKLLAEKRLGWYPAGSEDNIGNLPLGDTDKLEKQDSLQQLYKRLLAKKGKPTYLSEMLRVYAEMFHVLRPGGVACVVVKPFVKDRRVVDLPYITWCLLRAAGFTLEKAYKWRIERPSFWRLLYSKRFPEVPLPAHEYVLVARKPETSIPLHGSRDMPHP